MTAVEWALLFLALSGLAFVFVWALLIAGAAEDRRMEREAARRFVERQR